MAPRDKIPYGTPEMAWEVSNLMQIAEIRKSRVFAMQGHEGGIISFGKDLEESGRQIISWLGLSEMN